VLSHAVSNETRVRAALPPPPSRTLVPAQWSPDHRRFPVVASGSGPAAP